MIDGHAHFVIREQLRGFGADLLAVGTHAPGVTATTVFGSFARDLLADSTSMWGGSTPRA